MKSINKKIDIVNAAIDNELCKYSATIAKWRLTPDANVRPLNKKRNRDNANQNLSN